MSQETRGKTKRETERLILRPWRESDTEALFAYAKDPRIGPIAGWPEHISVENSRQIIKDVLMVDETYALTLKDNEGLANKSSLTDNSTRESTHEAIGCIGLLRGEKSNLDIKANEGEIGFWIGVPYWGQGLIPEAVQDLLHHGFIDLSLARIWCGYFEGNEKSRRVQEKCGFRYHHSNIDKPWPLMGDTRTEHVTCLTRKEWCALNM
jgi:RimJ/RimL family protein N-acetyltransferase